MDEIVAARGKVPSEIADKKVAMTLENEIIESYNIHPRNKMPNHCLFCSDILVNKLQLNSKNNTIFTVFQNPLCASEKKQIKKTLIKQILLSNLDYLNDFFFSLISYQNKFSNQSIYVNMHMIKI